MFYKTIPVDCKSRFFKNYDTAFYGQLWKKAAQSSVAC